MTLQTNCIFIPLACSGGSSSPPHLYQKRSFTECCVLFANGVSESRILLSSTWYFHFPLLYNAKKCSAMRNPSEISCGCIHFILSVLTNQNWIERQNVFALCVTRTFRISAGSEFCVGVFLLSHNECCALNSNLTLLSTYFRSHSQCAAYYKGVDTFCYSIFIYYCAHPVHLLLAVSCFNFSQAYGKDSLTHLFIT